MTRICPTALCTTLAVLSLALTAACDDEHCHGECPEPDAGPAAIDANPATPDAMAAMVHDSVQTIGVGGLVEGEITAGPADRAVIRLTAPAAFGWNMHGHANGSTQVVVEETGVMSVNYDFVPSAQADWFVLIANQGAAPVDVTVHIELYGAATFTGF
ncbi:MAG: hypothetical protein KA297_20270 [Kofleriaceae bacterium]|nr:hypothetical protein [Kofleriaceae bacterium]